jgi:hypothetical protein
MTMIRRSLHGLLLLGAAGLFVVTGPRVSAGELPKAEELLDKFAAATGSKEAYKKLKNRVLKGTISVEGLSGTVTTYQAHPGKIYSAIELAGLTLEEGVNNGVAWSKDPLFGAKLVSGTAGAAAVQAADLLHDVNWRKYFPKVETIGEEKVEDTPWLQGQADAEAGQGRLLLPGQENPPAPQAGHDRGRPHGRNADGVGPVGLPARGRLPGRLQVEAQPRRQGSGGDVHPRRA